MDLNENSEIFVVHVATLETTTIHPSQITLIAYLLWDKALTKILAKYSNYTDVLFLDLVIELSKNIKMNEHAIKLIKEKQPPYGSIYTLSLIELETLKAYIEILFKTGFIQPSKSFASSSIFLDKKPNGILCLCVNY